VTTNVWYYVAGVRGTNFLQLYVNGQLQGQASVRFSQSYSNLPVYFGSSGDPGFDGKLAGQLDEVSIYNRALSAGEIAAIYNAGASGKCKGSSSAGNPPVITNQPVGVAVVVSNTASFTVGVTGDAPLNYQWWFNETNAVGLNTNVLALNGVTATNAGNYSVIITNASGSATSTPAVLTVYFPPTIIQQPQSVTNPAGTTTGFTALATGIPVPNYQWQFDSTNIPGATASTLTLTNVQPAQAGDYTVVIGNPAGVVASSNAVLSVIISSPVITLSVDVLNNNFGLSFPTQNGLGYHLEYKDDLSGSNNWQELITIFGDGNPASLSLPMDAPMMRYFRLRVQ